jgi:hypothetical protein
MKDEKQETDVHYKYVIRIDSQKIHDVYLCMFTRVLVLFRFQINDR